MLSPGYYDPASDYTTVNLGKWLLRNLFAGLIQEEVHRDREYQKDFLEKLRLGHGSQSSRVGPGPPRVLSREQRDGDYLSHPGSRDTNGNSHVPATPGMSIGVIPESRSDGNSEEGTAKSGSIAEQRTPLQSQPRASGDRQSGSYQDDANARSSSDSRRGRPSTAEDTNAEPNPQSPSGAEKEGKKEGSFSFGSKLRMKVSKKLGRSSMDTKPPVVDEKVEEIKDAEVFHEEKPIEDNFLGTIQKIRYGFEDRVHAEPVIAGAPRIQPPPPNEAPELKLPPSTAIIIQEDRLDAGGVVDVYRGTVGSVARDADLVEKNAPMWLGDLLLLASLRQVSNTRGP